MRLVYFTHSLASCWNHGNAHFLRGVLSELIARGHDVRVYEPAGAWSLENLLADNGDAGLETIRARHTCAHRVDELLGILATIDAPSHSRSLPA